MENAKKRVVPLNNSVEYLSVSVDCSISTEAIMFRYQCRDFYRQAVLGRPAHSRFTCTCISHLLVNSSEHKDCVSVSWQMTNSGHIKFTHQRTHQFGMSYSFPKSVRRGELNIIKHLSSSREVSISRSHHTTIAYSWLYL